MNNTTIIFTSFLALISSFSFAQKTEAQQILNDKITPMKGMEFEWITEEEIWYNPLTFSSVMWREVDPLEQKESEVKKRDTYKIYELDVTPMLGKCEDAKNPLTCTDKNIRAIIKSEIDYPKDAVTKGHNGLETVLFVINEEGMVEGNYKVLSKKDPCESCALAAVRAISKIKQWTPGYKDGRPVKSKIAIPVRFKLL